MQKPLYLLPCIYAYKLFNFFVNIPFYALKYFLIGFFFSTISIINVFVNTVIKGIYSLIKYFVYGIVYFVFTGYKVISRMFVFFFKGVFATLKVLYKLFYYAFSRLFVAISYYFYLGLKNILLIVISLLYMFKNGVLFSFIIVLKLFKYLLMGIAYSFVAVYALYGNMVEKARIRSENRRIQREIKLEEKMRKKQEMIEEKRRRKEKNTYINDKVKIERKKLSDYINDFLESLVSLPKKIKQGIKDWYSNLTIVKNIANKKSVETQALLINFEGDDAKKSDVKLVYEYVAKNAEGKIVKGYFEAFSKVEVHSYLLSEGFEVYSIRTSKAIQFFHRNASGNKTKIKTKDLIFFLTQLSTYIKSGIPLVESLKILSRQFKNRSYQRIFKSLIYDLTMGDNFSEALAKQGVAFPRLLINMVKASELTGELPEALDDMAEYYTEIDKTRKQMITALTYPTIVFVLAIVVITFIMLFVIPKFVEIYQTMDEAQIPSFTLFVLNLSNFLQNNILIVLLIILVIVAIFIYLYKNVKLFKTFVQWVLMHTPVIGNIIIYNEVTMFTKTFSNLLAHNVFITDSMDILNRITSNEIYKMIILDTINNLAKGEKISLAFKHWAFPLPAYEMIVTGERTGQLPEMMDKVSKYYQELHRNAVGRIKSFIEPALIIFLTFAVGVIVLSIVIPMFDMYSAVQIG